MSTARDLVLAFTPEAAPTVPAAVLERLRAWCAMAQGAYSKNTVRAWAADWPRFVRFCERRGYACLPASPLTVRRFVLYQAAIRRKLETLRRYTTTITRIHAAAGLDSPAHSEPVRLALRTIARRRARLGRNRQEQARGLVWTEIAAYLERPPRSLRDHRDRALVCVAYDVMARSEELVAFDRAHLTWLPNGSTTLLITDSKTDQEGAGAIQWLAPPTAKLLRTWLDQSGIRQGALFPRTVGLKKLGRRLTEQSIGDVFQRVGKKIGLPEAEWKELSGHSARVGAAQDMGAANIELPGLMQVGRWKDPRMPVRYLERLSAQRGAMAQLAKLQGRVSSDPHAVQVAMQRD